ncbi:uncharacterized protein BT62DRAFT_274214 [Guyanagaster necrorhizus]|uniref:Uncharacterized protein n=1 Tax=Guyanagaster necrorhizus TaxID=856835 RepID=A0A9P7W273_9AGAR|nr:uncharacterized protein BT62DRAFT_274214 [Guyanagaster necrorhizus MCA 3950]KAG7451981.1 hypothetical protein BT62DRAFT_274214 [Guyanagaster necrorhizus MCA 3950]
MAPLRRSQRAATRKTYKSTESEPEDDDYGNDHADEAPVNKKSRPKKAGQDAKKFTPAAPKRCRIRRLLQKVAETPLDILFERPSTFVWKRARGNVEGLPPLPDDLSEPKYAHLAYDKHCVNCLCLTKFVQWESRTKYCRQCLETSDLFTTIVPDAFSGLVPVFEFWTPARRYRRVRHGYYYVPAINALREESETLCDETMDGWVRRKRVMYTTLQHNALLCDEWSTSRAEDRTNELDNLRSQRLEKVIERLTILGWGEEMHTPALIHELRCHKLVRQPRPLTERAWATMSGALVPIVERHKADRLEREMIRAVETRARSFATAYSDATRDVPLLPIFPKAVDAALLEPFSKIVFDTPLDQDITEPLKAAWIHLPEVAVKWRETQDSGLRALMEKAGLKPDLNLATAFFSCNYCRRVCQYPYVLAHCCALSYRGRIFNSEDWMTYALMHMSPGASVAWSASQYTVGGDALKKVQYIIQTCGLNPETATCEDMNSLDCRVIYNYHNNYLVEFVMQWQTAACYEDYKGASPNAWKLLDDAEKLERVKTLEKLDKEAGYTSYTSKDSSYSRGKLVCSHCKVLRCSGRELEDHLLEAHSTTSVSSDDWDWPVNMSYNTGNGRGVFLHAALKIGSVDPQPVP